MDVNREKFSRHAIRAAGRSVRGGRKDVNAEYVCCVTYPGPGAIRGIYGVADGAAGNIKSELASELAVETFKNEVGRQLDEGNVDAGEILESAVQEVNRGLVEGRPLEEDGGRFAASFVFCIIDENTAHIACAGGGVAYYSDREKIVRLTEKFTPADYEGTEYTEPRPGTLPAGWPGAGFSPIFISQEVGPGGVLVFCSDGVHSRVDNITIQEMLLGGNTVEEGIDHILEEAHERDGAEDVSAVAVSFHQPGTGGEAEPAGRSRGAVRKRTIAVLSVLVLAAGFLLAGTDLGRRMPWSKQPGKNASEEGGEGRKLVPPKRTKAVKNGVEIYGTISLRTGPAGAKIFLDGVEQEKVTPAELELPAGNDVELRLESAGYQPYIERIAVEKGMRLERVMELAPLKPGNGSVLVICRPRCTGLTLDGTEIKGFPRDEIMMREIIPGNHLFSASFGEGKEERNIKVVSGITQSLLFSFHEERDAIFKSDGSSASGNKDGVDVVEAPKGKSAPATKEAMGEYSSAGLKRTPPRLSMKRTGPVSISGKEEPEGTGATEEDEKMNGADESTAAPGPVERISLEEPVKKQEKVEKAVLVVNTNAGKCNIMLMKGGYVEAAGLSGSMMMVEPGDYTLVAARAGYEDATQEISLGPGKTVLEMQLKVRR